MPSSLPKFEPDTEPKLKRAKGPTVTEVARLILGIAIAAWIGAEFITLGKLAREIELATRAGLVAPMRWPHVANIAMAAAFWIFSWPVFAMVDDTRANRATLEEIAKNLKPKP